MELPTHPEDHDAPGPHQPPPSPRRRPSTVALAVVGALVVVVILLHLTGVIGPAGN